MTDLKCERNWRDVNEGRQSIQRGSIQKRASIFMVVALCPQSTSALKSCMFIIFYLFFFSGRNHVAVNIKSYSSRKV